jgi:hypothetical protein
MNNNEIMKKFFLVRSSADNLLCMQPSDLWIDLFKSWQYNNVKIFCTNHILRR